MTVNDLETFKSNLVKMVENHLHSLIILEKDGLRLDPLQAFIVSNQVISSVLTCYPDELEPLN